MDKNLENWQEELDDLKVDIDMETDMVVDKFESYKNSLTTYLDEVTEKVDEVVGEHAGGLRSKIDELRVQLALGRAESRDAYEEQRKKLDESLHMAQSEFTKLADGAGEALGSSKDEFESRVEKFRTRMDLFRLHFHLGKEEAKDEWEEKRKNLSMKLSDLRQKADKAEENAEDKWEDFSKEMGQAYGHFKDAVKRLFD